MTVTPEQVRAWREAADMATPGPWYHGFCWRRAGTNPQARPGPGCIFCGEHGAPSRSEPDDRRPGEFIHWHRSKNPVQGGSGEHNIEAENGVTVVGMFDYEEGGVVDPRDAALIVAAREAVPALCDEVERLRSEVEELRSTLSTYEDDDMERSGWAGDDV